jgi:hypothetical protein
VQSRFADLHVVPNPAKAVATKPTLIAARRAGALALVAVVIGVVGCGGGSSSQPQADVGPNVGQPIRLADCDDWNQANTEERLGTIEQLEGFASGPVVGNNASSPSGTGSVLDDKQAYDLFNRWCERSFAQGFKLYKLYERAAAFTGQPAQ